MTSEDDEGGDDEAPQPSEAYEERLATLQRLLEGGSALDVVKSEIATSASQVEEHFDTWVDGGEAEGLVIRAEDGRIFKLKPVVTIDAVVVGFTERFEKKDQAGSILLALPHASTAPDLSSAQVVDRPALSAVLTAVDGAASRALGSK